jgi:hypothetical protein
MAEILLLDVNGAQFLLSTLTDELRRDHLLGDAGIDQDKIVLGDLHTALFGVELAWVLSTSEQDRDLTGARELSR